MAGFVQVPHALLTRAGVSPSAIATYAAMFYRVADYGGRGPWDGEASLAQLCRSSGIKDPRTVNRWVRWLEREGFVRVDRRASGGGRATVYTLGTYPPATIEGGPPATSEGGPPATSEGGPPATNVPHYIKDRKKNPPEVGVVASLLEQRGLDRSAINGAETELIGRLLDEKGYEPGELVGVVWDRDGIELTAKPRWLRARLTDALSRPSNAARQARRREAAPVVDVIAEEQERMAEEAAAQKAWDALTDDQREAATAQARAQLRRDDGAGVRALARALALQTYGLDGARITQESADRLRELGEAR